MPGNPHIIEFSNITCVNDMNIGLQEYLYINNIITEKYTVHVVKSPVLPKCLSLIVTCCFLLPLIELVVLKIPD